MFSGGRGFVSPGQFFREVAERRSEASVRFWDFGSFRKNAFRGDRFDASSSPFIKKKITWGPEAGNWGGSRGGERRTFCWAGRECCDGMLFRQLPHDADGFDAHADDSAAEPDDAAGLVLAVGIGVAFDLAA